MHEGKHGILDDVEDMDDLFGMEDEEGEDETEGDRMVSKSDDND